MTFSSYKSWLLEKFTEDSDPIKDLGIGINSHKNFNSYDELHKWLYKIIPTLLNVKKQKNIIEPNQLLGILIQTYYDQLRDYCEKYITIKNNKIDRLYPEGLKTLILSKNKNKE